MNGGDARMKRLMVAVAIMMVAGVGQAQASKPKAVGQKTTSSVGASGNTTATKIGGAVTEVEIGRTSSGRPSDLDPRIPWMDDLQMPQSGGPDPLVIKNKFIENAPGGYISENGFAVLETGNIVRAGSGKVRVFSPEGKLLWWRSLTQSDGSYLVINRAVAGEGGIFYLITGGDLEYGKTEDILGLDDHGNSVGKWKWPVQLRGQIYEISYSKGRIFANFRLGPRISVEVDNQVGTTEADIPTSADFSFDKKDSKSDTYILNVLSLEDDYDPTEVVRRKDELKRRKIRAAKLRVQAVSMKDVPFFMPVQKRPKYDPTHLQDLTRVVSLKRDGGLILQGEIRNPKGLSGREMSDYGAERERRILAWFDRNGKYLRYLILNQNQTVSVFGDRICLLLNGEVQVWGSSR